MKLVTATPIPVGIQLYHGLSETFNILLVTDDDKEFTDHWLKLENLTKQGTVLYGEENREQKEQRIKQVNSLRHRGFAVDLVVEPDPEIAAELLHLGYNVCNFLHSAYAYPSWRPDFEGEEKGWEKIAERVERDILMRENDTRLDPDNTELW